MKRLSLIAALAVIPFSAHAGGGDEFSFHDAGDLHPGSGTGAADATVYVPGMRYPMEAGPSFPNSQVWGHGGGSGPGGGQCDTENYSYPWRDNYCETRSWNMPLCPSGAGHQGQDIRPATCDAGEHWNVASEAGTVTNIGSYSVYMTAADGTRFDYLHGSGNAVSNGQSLAKGERINRVDNEFGGTSTTIHLHYNIKQDVAGIGFVFVSPYMSLVESYRDLLGLGGETVGDAVVDSCSAVVGWAHDENAPQDALSVQVYFDGGPGDRAAVGIEVLADEYRESLCEMLGSCEHGFTLELPRSLQDGQEHPIKLFSGSSEDSAAAEIETSSSFACDTPAIPSGEIRRIEGPAAVSTWGLSPFWDAAVVDDTTIADLPVGESFPERPVLVRADGDDTVWWMDPGSKRRVADASVAEAWGLDLNDAEVWPAHVLAEISEGPPMREDVFLLQAPDGTLYVVDDPACEADGCEPGEDSDGGSDSDSNGADADDADDAGGGGTNGTSPVEDDEDSAALPGADEADEGCGCRSDSGPAGPAWLLLSVLGLWRRRESAR